MFGFNVRIKNVLNIQFNLARSTLPETRRLLNDVMSFVAIPSTLNASSTSLHMAKCVAEAVGANIYVVMYTHLKGKIKNQFLNKLCTKY